MKRVKITATILSATLSILLSQGAHAIDAAGLTDVIRNANILKYDKAPKVTIIGAQITTSIDPMGPAGKTSDQDLKIDALLVSKSLFDSSGQELTASKIIFSNGGKEAKYTIISRQKVSEYSSGAVNAQELLSSLVLTPVMQENQPEVAEGPFYERRILVWERIENLRKQGTGIKPFEQLSADLEASIKSNSDQKEIFKKLTSLEDKLSGQEQHSAQAKKVAQGKGIHGNVTASASIARTNSGSSNAATQTNNGPLQNIIQARLLVGKMPILRQALQSKNDQEGLARLDRVCHGKNQCNDNDVISAAEELKRIAKERGLGELADMVFQGNGPRRR